MTGIPLPSTPIPVIGIGADGWDGLGGPARREIAACEVLLGSARQLALIPEGETRAERVPWPSPLVPALSGLLERYAGRRLGVLASGDPMYFGIGVTLTKLVGAQALRVLPQPSSASLACARLGWALNETPVVSAVGRRVETVLPELSEGRRVLVLSSDERTPAQVAELLARQGFGASALTVLEQLGGPDERILRGAAADWGHPAGDPLNIVAIDAVADPKSWRLTRIPGLPDEVYGGDGQLTKAEVRALTLSALAPAPGELLWDVGGGSGTIAIEWCRTDPACRAFAFERMESRRKQITANATALGVPVVEVRGAAPESFADLTAPDAIFIGGGLTQDGMFDACWTRLRPGGRLVAAAVTAESDALLLRLAEQHGGALRRFQVYRAEPLGGFTAWRPHLPVTQWTVVKPAAAEG
ncbi:bifunctional cobalt-precorrin-7 (C(5))-methyltransferase/cobalt-precorrin-6B (C(15))-methyltransferase [Nocardia niigatensis]|uniref:bifunctional cobalt-precorrin-7 (C(5))-methyltransferase/cobalt-precorrin-6B (C(15))-methyltransferase n=1 Tax=Nocardia niigatensis TaxID=209249 RepID=UPI00030F9B1B|nr:bifunctional cobalt-precorrin-7 (C(5))-methyltransferase/cobalt-precorrin-6B (C(15))-methyltransferase [Nocardia niigatensis]